MPLLLSLLSLLLLNGEAAETTCWDTPLLAATSISSAVPHIPDPGVPTTTAALCKTACCVAELCVAWSFGPQDCILFTERGVLSRAGPDVVSGYRAMSVPPDQSWMFNWDMVPLFTHSSNASGLYSPSALANLTASNRYSVVGLDWEVNFYPTLAHHLRQNTIAQAQSIVSVAPAIKVLVYQQGFLALNFSDDESVAIQDKNHDNWWVHNQDGTVFTWDAGDCDFGVHCARVMNASVPAMRQWYVESVALPTLAADGVSGLFVDNSMQLGMPYPSQGAPWHSIELQHASAQLQKEIGLAMLEQHPGKRTLLSVLQIGVSAPQSPIPAPGIACSEQPYQVGFERGGFDYMRFVMSPNASSASSDTLAQHCRARCCADTRCEGWGVTLRTPTASQQCPMGTTCCWLKGAGVSGVPSKWCGGDYGCITGLVVPPTQQRLAEQDLLMYWRDIPWSRYYDGASPQSWITATNPEACVAYVRNMQAEALAGIPVVAGTGMILDDAQFKKALAMFLIAAENHSRIGYMNGYVCTDPADPYPPPGLPPHQVWSNTSCTWLWRPEFEKRLGQPRSWGDWDGGFKFEREFEYLSLSLDCATGAANFTWRGDDVVKMPEIWL